jgi:membrane protein DedA with SNARE-associated domain
MSSSPSDLDATLTDADQDPAPAWLVWAAATLALATAAGAVAAPYLAVNHPYWLLALNAFPRHQLLVAPHLEVAPFVTLVAFRGLFTCWISYELGRHYGVRGTAALEGRMPSFGRTLRVFEQYFGRFSHLIVLFVPGFLSSALAGTSGMARHVTLALSLVGLFGWAFINHQLGGLLAPYTQYVLKFMAEHMLAATLICAALVGLYQLSSYRKRRVAGSVAVASDKPAEQDVSGL